MNKYYLPIIVGIFLTSCSIEFREVQGERFELSTTSKLDNSLVLELENYFVENQNRFIWLNLNKINALRLDSNYFSYQIYLAVVNSEDSSWVDKLNPITELVSTELLNDIPIHIFVTDANFNVLHQVPFTTDYLLPGNLTLSLGKLSMTIDGQLNPNAFASGLSDVLNEIYPSVLNNSDSVNVNALIKNERIIIDITLNQAQINIDKLNTSLSTAQPLLFNLLLNYRAGTMNFINSEDGKIFKVVMIK